MLLKDVTQLEINNTMQRRGFSPSKPVWKGDAKIVTYFASFLVDITPTASWKLKSDTGNKEQELVRLSQIRYTETKKTTTTITRFHFKCVRAFPFDSFGFLLPFIISGRLDAGTLIAASLWWFLVLHPTISSSPGVGDAVNLSQKQ